MKYLAKKYTREEIELVKANPHFKATNHVWDISRCKSIKNAGPCAKTAKDYLEHCDKEKFEPTLEDWEEYYFNNCKDYKEFCENADKFKQKLKDNFIQINSDDAYLYSWVRIIFDTYVGVIEKERNIIGIIKDVCSDDCVVRPSTEQEDEDFAIDIVAFNNKETIGYQVKPQSFINGLKGKYNANLKEDYLKIVERQKKFLAANNPASIQWIIYIGKDELDTYEPSEMQELYKKGIK